MMKFTFMFENKLAILMLLTFSLLPFSGISQVINVPDDYATIQEGIDAAIAGDTVLVAPGTYQENIDFSGKAIHLLSAEGPEQTIIDGNQAGSCVTFDSDEGQDSIIDGFTLTNGTGTFDPNVKDFVGGGIYMNGNVSSIIQNNIITGNDAFSGGGISFRNSAAIEGSPSILNNNISNNFETGISIVAVNTVTITGNTFSQNGEEGMFLWVINSGLVENNVLSENAEEGAFIRSMNNVTVSNNLIDNNGSDGISHREVENTTITENTIINNQGEGIFVWISDGDVNISRNIIENNSSNGLFLRDVETALVDSNKFRANNVGAHCWFVENVSYVNNLITDSSSDGFSLRNVTAATLFNNTSMNNGEAGIRTRNADNVIVGNSIIRENLDDEILVMFDGIDPLITYSNIEDGYDGVGNIDADPLFVDAPNGDFKLLSGSPSIDAGDSSLVPAGIVEDLDGSPRFTDDIETPDTGNGDAPVVDMGPYELITIPPLSVQESLVSDFILYPNPVSSVINLKSVTLISKVEIYTILGKRVLSQNTEANEVQLNVSTLKSGIYLIEIESSNGSSSLKFIKR